MKDHFKSFNSGRANFFLVAFIACMLAGAVMKVTSPVILPFTISVLLAFVMNPMVSFLEKWHIPRLFSILLAVSIIIIGLYLMGMVLFSSGRTILTLYPKYESRLTEIYLSVADFFEFSYDEHLSFFENLWSQLGVRTRIRNITFFLSNSFIAFLKDAFMVVLFVVFLLVEASYFKEKIEVAFENKRSGVIKKISTDVMIQVSRYLSMKFIISLVTGGLVAIGLSMVGLEFAIVWGVIQFILNFIPNIGSITAGVGVGLFALLQFWPEPGPIIIAVLIMLGTNMIIGNILEPKIMGDNLGLSPIVVLISLVLWGWIWGFAGMILAVPMMVIIKILCENVPVLEPLSILLGSRKAVLAKKAENEAAVSGKNDSGDVFPDVFP
ncbi:MAG: AI-2E family transporter [Treponema sp.]|nr:AI-2E family transporter [Treponema sp.]